MRRLKLTIEYEGTNYCGWQSQAKGVTIQDTLEAGLGRIVNHRVRIVGSGRTDSGVHALGQVAHVDTSSRIDLKSLQRGVNSVLPADILVKAVEEVDEGFHARFSARSRLYEYRLWNAGCPNVFQRNYSWWIRDTLDVELMREAAQWLLGAHDFASFQGADRKKVSPERVVMEAVVVRKEEAVIFRVRSNSFLRHMVRNIVGTLVDVGTKRMSVDEFARTLKARDRSQSGITAPPQGLFLVRVYY